MYEPQKGREKKGILRNGLGGAWGERVKERQGSHFYPKQGGRGGGLGCRVKLNEFVEGVTWIGY